jgi:hypothetical protein
MGFTLVEMMVAMVVMIIAASAIGTVMVDNQRGWSALYDSVHSDVTTDGYVARKKFDTVIRNASRDKIVLGDAGGSVEVYYYSAPAATVVDRYVRFYSADGDLNIEYGRLNPKVTSSVETVCSNVTQCVFSQAGCSVQMKLTLDDGTRKNTIISSAVLNNQ